MLVLADNFWTGHPEQLVRNPNPEARNKYVTRRAAQQWLLQNGYKKNKQPELTLSSDLEFDAEHAKRLADPSIDTMPEPQLDTLKIGASIVVGTKFLYGDVLWWDTPAGNGIIKSKNVEYYFDTSVANFKPERGQKVRFEPHVIDKVNCAKNVRKA